MIFIDTDAFVATAVSSDSNHRKALILVNLIREQEEELMTSSPVFGEAVTVLSQRGGREVALRFIEEFSESGIVLIEVDAHLREKGILVFKKQASKNVSFTDCVNIAIMQEHALTTIFSFDSVYKKNGLKRFGIA